MNDGGIVYLSPGCFDKGGISRYCRYQAQALREILGPDRVKVLSLLGPDASSMETPFPVHFAAGGLSPKAKAMFVAEATRATWRTRPRVVHTAHVNFSAVAWGLARALGATSVCNVYGAEIWAPDSADARFGLRRVDHVVADCHFTARFVDESGSRPGRTTDVVWDCVDLKRFRPGPPSPAVVARYGIPDPETHVNILTLGRISRRTLYKGFLRLLQAFQRIAPLEPRLRLIYTGTGNFLEELKRAVASSGVADRIVVTGAVHEDDLPEIYRCGSIFSLIGNREPVGGEGIPLTPLEAAASGAAVLVGNRDGSAEAVTHGESGYVLDPFDIEAIAEALLRLARDADLRARFGTGARHLAERHFSYEAFRDKHVALLEKWGALRPAVQRSA